MTGSGPTSEPVLASPTSPSVEELASKHLPYFFKGTVVHGFGRGGKQLNCPTGEWVSELWEGHALPKGGPL